MYKKSALFTLAMFVTLLLTVGSGLQAGEIIYVDDINESIVSKEVLVRTADNIIILMDTSSSMAARNKTYKKPYYDLQKEALTRGAGRLPDLGWNLGIYRFTPWEEIYPVQKFDRAAVAESLKKLPAEPSGKTPLVKSMNELETVLKGLSGSTFVYLFSDGGYDHLADTLTPGDKATTLAKKYNVCFQVIDYSVQERDRKNISDMSRANMCSRAIPFDSYVTQPLYATAPLFYTKWDTEVVTTSEKKVAGYKVNDIVFEFDSYELSAEGRAELEKVGKFLTDNPEAFVAVFGYTDETGKSEYNIELSRRRAEAVADFLYDDFNLGPDRVIPIWYGAANPIASNDTDEGRAKNRRVELSIGGL